MTVLLCSLEINVHGATQGLNFLLDPDQIQDYPRNIVVVWELL